MSATALDDIVLICLFQYGLSVWTSENMVTLFYRFKSEFENNPCWKEEYLQAKYNSFWKLKTFLEACANYH